MAKKKISDEKLYLIAGISIIGFTILAKVLKNKTGIDINPPIIDLPPRN